jgi:transposase-like protein
MPLRKWFWAIFLMSTSKKGVSMLYLQRQLKINSYRTIWLMGQKIRQAMKQRNALYQINGTAEVDEIHIGGQQSHEQRRQHPNKTPFLIAVQEGNNGGPRYVSFEELETVYEQHILPALKKQVKEGSRIKTDGASAYISAKGYQHDPSVYSRDKEKTQKHLYWVNMLTSNLKRFLISTYHGVDPKYRHSYLAEFAYRFNRRYWPNQAFDRLLYACIIGKPTTLPEIKA